MLTIGDGLVTQIPALIVSTAAGLMVTSAGGTSRMGVVLTNQLGAHPRALYMAAGVLGVFALIPGLPMFPFLMLGGGMAALGRMSGRTRRSASRARRPPRCSSPRAAHGERPDDRPAADRPIELEVGYALIPLVDERQGGDLLERISLLRKQAAVELGILIPPIRIRDDIRLPSNEYVIKLRGSEMARAEVMPRFLMALDNGGAVGPIDGMDTVDPSFGMPAKWIATAKRGDAESYGYVVVEPTTVVATHLMEVLKGNAADLLGRQDVQEMVETLKKSHPALVEDLIPNKLSLGILHRVLQRPAARARAHPRPRHDPRGAGRRGRPDQGPRAAHRARAPLAHQRHRAALHRRRGRGARHHDGAAAGAGARGAVQPARRPAGHGAAHARRPRRAAARPQPARHRATRSTGGRCRSSRRPSLRVGVRRLIEPVLPALPVVSLAELPATVTLQSAGLWEMRHA
jgi:flagellar biosynthesis protein FlhA